MFELKKFKCKHAQKIYNYVDYRLYLNDYLRGAKEVDTRFTIGRFAKSLELKDTSSINKILKGQRDPGSLIVDKLCQYFKFNRRQGHYFYDLVSLAKNPKEGPQRFYILERLKKNNTSTEFKLLDLDQFNAIANWYCFAIRELIRLDGFKNDIDWIQKSLLWPVKKSEISEALKNLENVGLIKKDQQRGWVIANSRYCSSKDVPSEALKRFHEKSLTHAKESIRTIDITKRLVTGSTLAIDSNMIEKIKKDLVETLDNICPLFESPTGDQVYQLNIQFYPLTEKIKEK